MSQWNEVARVYSKPVDEKYLKDKYGLYLQSRSTYYGRKGRGSVISSVDYSKVVAEIFRESWSAKNDYDCSSSSTIIYLLSDNKEDVERIKSLDPEHNQLFKVNGVEMRREASCPEGEAHKDYFKPIFRDLSLNANLKDPFQHEYDAVFRSRFEKFLKTLDIIDQSYWGKALSNDKETGLQTSNYYFVEDGQGNDICLQIYFDRDYENGGYIMISPTSGDSIEGYTSVRLTSGEEVKKGIEEMFTLLRQRSDNVKGMAKEVSDEFSFLTEGNSGHNGINSFLNFGNAFDILIGQDKFCVRERVYNSNLEESVLHLEFGLVHANVLPETSTVNFSLDFETLGELKEWLRSEDNLTPFKEFEIRLADLREEAAKNIERKRSFTSKFQLKDITGFELKHFEDKDEIYGDVVEYIGVYANGHLVEKQQLYTTLIEFDDKAFRKHLADVLFEGVKNVLMELLREELSEIKSKYSKEVIQGCIWFEENAHWVVTKIAGVNASSQVFYGSQSEEWKRRKVEVAALKWAT